MTGLFACMALAAAKLVYNRYIVLFVPFVSFIVLQTVLQFFDYNAAAPYFIMDASQTTWEKPAVVIVVMILLFLFTFSAFYLMGGKKRDML